MMRLFLFGGSADWRVLPLNKFAAIAFFLIFSIRAQAQEPAQKSEGLAPLPLALPAPALKGTPQNLSTNTTAPPPTDKAPAPFYAPKGVKNIALGKPVTSSNPAPINGDLQQITDGKKQAFEENVVTLRRGLQWVQLDLQGEYNLYAIVLWHDFTTAIVYRDVIVQVSDDPQFEAGVHTLFNNDQSNHSGLGAGTDREYFENPLTGEGKLVDAKGIKARYLRCYSHGSTADALNTYIEIEAYGLPAS
ncbi:MAG TPA: hypothetical protein VGR14_03370 [Verrucomicrobiae bacterium]|jgi:hypothetical protein|nr:hypothetical protein [Verrucomicrobiae bacterium]